MRAPAATLGLACLMAGTGVAQQGITDNMGPLLRVPPADEGLFFKDQPVVVAGRTLIPMAALERWLRPTTLTERLGEITFVFHGGTGTPIEITMWVDEKRAKVARAEVPLEVAPRVIEDTLYLPLKFVAEAVGIWVEHHGRRVRLRKPDLDWACWLAIPPHPKSLEGKMTALAIARRPETLKRIENVALAPDTVTGHVAIAEPSEDGKSVIRYVVQYERDKTGWHFVSEEAPAPAEEPGD